MLALWKTCNPQFCTRLQTFVFSFFLNGQIYTAGWSGGWGVLVQGLNAFNPMVEWPLAVLPSRSLWSFLAIGYTVCLPLSLSFKTLSYATPEWLLIKCLLILSKEVCLAYFSKLMSVNNVCRLACIPQIAFYVMKHYGNSPGSLEYSAHIAGIFFFSVYCTWLHGVPVTLK